MGKIINFKKYKITQKGKLYYVYRRGFLFFWYYDQVFSFLDTAENYVKDQLKPEVTIKYLG